MNWHPVLVLLICSVLADFERNELTETVNETLQEKLVNARNQCAILTNFTKDEPIEIRGNLIDLEHFQTKLEQYSVCFLTKLNLLNPINGQINKEALPMNKSFLDIGLTVLIKACLEQKHTPEATAVYFMKCSRFVY